jgi:uncharacterized OB-fold protein
MTALPFSAHSPLPDVDESTAPHWDGLDRGRLVLRRCGVCGSLNHPVAQLCRVCESPDLSWHEVSTRVTLFSWAIEGRAIIPGLTPPFVIGQVTPEECGEGEVRLIGLLDVAHSDLEIGLPLTLRPAQVPGFDKRLAVYARE